MRIEISAFIFRRLKGSPKVRLWSMILVTSFLCPALADASHFRSGQLSWTQGSGNTVHVSLQTTWRRDGYSSTCVDLATMMLRGCSGAGGFPGVGDVVLEFIGGTQFNWGDGSAPSGSPFGPLLFKVNSVDPANNWWSGAALDADSFPAEDTQLSHTYPAGGDFLAYVQACCRIGRVSGVNEHINNPNGSYRLETLVTVGSGNESPVSALPPIVSCPKNTTCNFVVPGADPDGDTLLFRLSNGSEAAGVGDFFQPGPDVAPNAANIDPASGLLSWNTTGATLAGNSGNNTLYSSQITIEDSDSKIPVDFLIRLVEEDVRPPTISPPPNAPPICDSTQVVTVENTKQFDIVASDPDNSDVVTLNVASLPASALMSPELPLIGNPVTSTFSWTPSPADVGTYIVNFNASSSAGGFVLCPVTIEVSSCAPPDPALVFADNSQGKGLFAASIASVQANGKTRVEIRVEPTEVVDSLWFSIEPVASDSDAISIRPNSDDLVGGFWAERGVIGPGSYASYVADFCQTGELNFRVTFDRKAADMTINQYLIGIIPFGDWFLVVDDIAEGLLSVPLYQSAVEHFVNAWRQNTVSKLIRELYGAMSDLLRLAASREQLAGIAGEFAEAGVDLKSREIAGALRSIARDMPGIVTDAIVTGVQTSDSDILITIRAD